MTKTMLPILLLAACAAPTDAECFRERMGEYYDLTSTGNDSGCELLATAEWFSLDAASFFAVDPSTIDFDGCNAAVLEGPPLTSVIEWDGNTITIETYDSSSDCTARFVGTLRE